MSPQDNTVPVVLNTTAITTPVGIPFTKGESYRHSGQHPPWQKGQSGNPNGRPRRVPPEDASYLIARNTKRGADLVAFLLKVVKGEVPNARVADRVDAAVHLMDRLWGKPVTSLELSGPGGGPIEAQSLVAHLDTDSLRKLVELREQMLALAPPQAVAQVIEREVLDSGDGKESPEVVESPEA